MNRYCLPPYGIFTFYSPNKTSLLTENSCCVNETFNRSSQQHFKSFESNKRRCERTTLNILRTSMYVALKNYDLSNRCGYTHEKINANLISILFSHITHKILR